MKKIFIFLSVFILTFIIFDLSLWALKGYIAPKIPRKKESIWEARMNQLEKLSYPAEVIFLGDSTVKNAINEVEASNALKKKVINLGLTGDLVTYGDYRILVEYLKRYPAPKTVVLWHTVDVWQRTVEPFIFKYANPSTQDLIDEFNNSHQRRPHKFLTFLFENILVNFSSLYRFKIYFRELYSELFQAPPNENVVATKPQIYWPKNVPPGLSKDAVFWLKRLKNLCNQNKIKLFVVHSPLLLNFYRLPTMQSFLSKQNEQLSSHLKELGIQLLTKDNYVFNEEDTYNSDKDHVNINGAIKTTKFYIEVLEGHL